MSLWKIAYAENDVLDLAKLSKSEKIKQRVEIFNQLEKNYNEKFVPNYPNSYASYSSLMAVAHTFELNEKSVKAFKDGVKKFPNSYTLYFRRAAYLKLYHEFNFKERVKLLKKVIELYPRAGQAYIQLVVIGHRNPKLVSLVEQDKYLQLAEKHTSSRYFVQKIKYLNVIKQARLGNTEEAEKILTSLPLIDEYGDYYLYAQMSNAFYKKANSNRAWAYYLLTWSVSENLIKKDLGLEENLKAALTNQPKTAHQWFLVAVRSNNKHNNGLYPRDGIIKAFENSLNLLTDKDKDYVRSSVPKYLAQFMVEKKNYDKAIELYKRSLNEKEDYWVASSLAYYVYQNEEKKGNKRPDKIAYPYYLTAAEIAIKNKYHLTKNPKSYIKKIFYTAKLALRNKKFKKSIELFTSMLDAKTLTPNERADYNLFIAAAYRRLKDRENSLKHIELSKKLATTKKLLKEIKDEEKYWK